MTASINSKSTLTDHFQIEFSEENLPTQGTTLIYTGESFEPAPSSKNYKCPRLETGTPVTYAGAFMKRPEKTAYVSIPDPDKEGRHFPYEVRPCDLSPAEEAVILEHPSSSKQTQDGAEHFDAASPQEP
jgi:hypothetical protein